MFDRIGPATAPLDLRNILQMRSRPAACTRNPAQVVNNMFRAGSDVLNIMDLPILEKLEKQSLEDA